MDAAGVVMRARRPIWWISSADMFVVVLCRTRTA
jgi:hypothetical protein